MMSGYGKKLFRLQRNYKHFFVITKHSLKYTNCLKNSVKEWFQKLKSAYKN